MPQPFEVNAMLADTFEPKRQNRFLFQFTDVGFKFKIINFQGNFCIQIGNLIFVYK